jgi:flagellar hook-associated protein 1 FlgK
VKGPSGGTIDLLASGSVRGGKIAGLIDLRDTLLPKAQSQLDDLAAGLASSLSDRKVASSSVSNGLEVDTTGLQSGNRINVDFTDTSGNAHHVSIIRVEGAALLPLSNAATADPNDEVIGVSFSGGVAGALSSLQAGLNGLGAGLTASVGTTANTLRLTATASASVTALSATVTNTALKGQGTPLPLFTDSPGGTPFTASLDGKDQRVGFASRMIVNPQLLSSSNALADYTGTTSSNDPTRINDLVSQLNQQGVTVSVESGLGVTSGSATVATLVRQIAQSQANDTNRLTSLNDSQSTILASIQSRFSQSSGVNMDKELMDLTQLQNVYTANARVLTAVKDMFDVLMRM